MTVNELTNLIIGVLQGKFEYADHTPYRVYDRRHKDGYVPECFYIETQRIGSSRIANGVNQKDVQIFITFFPLNDQDIARCYEVEEILDGLFDREIVTTTGEFALEVRNKAFDMLENNALTLAFDTSIFEDKAVLRAKDTEAELMGELHMR